MLLQSCKRGRQVAQPGNVAAPPLVSWLAVPPRTRVEAKELGLRTDVTRTRLCAAQSWVHSWPSRFRLFPSEQLWSRT